MKAAVRKHALELGFDECRFTTADLPGRAEALRKWIESGRHGEMGWIARNQDKRINPQKVLPGAQSIITLAASYYRTGSESEAAHGSPRGPSGIIARYARYEDYHDVLAGRLKELTAILAELGGAGHRSLWYVDTGPILERELAERAGIGFAGKHTNLISRKLGNWFFLAEIITTIPFEPDPPERNRCGSCTRCLSACPTNAITAPFELDARRCISYLTIELKGPIPLELRPLIGNRIFGCDDCLAACPWNRFAAEGGIMGRHARAELEKPDLIELLSMDAAAFRARFRGTPILRTKRRGLLRNVCIALGNTGDSSVLPALEKAAADPEPLIAEHALWACHEIQVRTR